MARSMKNKYYTCRNHTKLISHSIKNLSDSNQSTYRLDTTECINNIMNV